MAEARNSGRTSPDTPQREKVRSTPLMEEIARQLALQVSEQLPVILQTLQEGGWDPESNLLQLECNLTTGNGFRTNNRVPVTALSLGRDITPFSSVPPTPRSSTNGFSDTFSSSVPATHVPHRPNSSTWSWRMGGQASPDDSDSRPNKRRKDQTVSSGHGDQLTGSASNGQAPTTSLVPLDDGPRKKRATDNPALQPSTFDKFVGGVWESIYSGLRMDPTEVIEQWQAIEGSAQPKLLTDSEHHVAIRDNTSAFGRINVLARKISQTSRTCRSLEVIVQAHWIQCFEDRVNELAEETTREKAKKAAIAEACVDFSWTEKELRNKMAIWRGYHDIQTAGGWVALVFAGMGLYRFCKYRVSFTEETFDTLRALKHRFEVAADTLHPRWRIMLGIVGESTQPKYRGHPHDWVVNGPDHEAIPLPQTYHQWDKNFAYTHLNGSVVDVEAWGDYDPRIVMSATDTALHKCEVCNEHQADDPTRNGCHCYPNLYGSPKGSIVPLQVFRTPNGKNNGLLACATFEKCWAVGEFVGLITSGLAGLDVMVGQTDHATYQIWQGRQGNHTRFVNHSCQPNSHFERFVWLGKQRIVLVSKGIEAGEEVTVDYGHTYWQNLDKVCMCWQPNCRYQDRNKRQLITPPDDGEHDEI